jgi:4-hydroxy-3-polyprenylbenzoate decarboxylase
MNFAKPYEDLREFIDALDEHGKLYRIHREINKDSELQPLVRWQFRGGIAEEARRGFLFDNVTDGKSEIQLPSARQRAFGLRSDLLPGSQMPAGRSRRPLDLCYGSFDRAGRRPVRAHARKKSTKGGESARQRRLLEFAVPMSTPGFDNWPIHHAGHWIT